MDSPSSISGGNPPTNTFLEYKLPPMVAALLTGAILAVLLVWSDEWNGLGVLEALLMLRVDDGLLPAT